MDDQRTDRENGKCVGPAIAARMRERLWAGVLSLVYIGGWALALYAYSLRIEDHWPARMFWVVAAYIASQIPAPNQRRTEQQCFEIETGHGPFITGLITFLQSAS